MVDTGYHSTTVTEWSSIHHFYRPDLTTQNNCGLLCGIVQYSAPCALNMPEQTRQLGFIQKIGWIFLPILNKRHICACLLYYTVPGQVQPRRPLQSNGNVVSICFPQNMEVVHNTQLMNHIARSARYIVGSNRQRFVLGRTDGRSHVFI